METVKRLLDRFLFWATVVLFALLVIIVVWQVFSRQVLQTPATWTDEGARLTFVWLGLFASAFVFGERAHIAMEFVVRKLPEGLERALAIFGQVVVLGFSAIALIWGGWRASQNAWTQKLSALPFTYGQMYLALPVAGVLIAFYAIYYIVNLATRNVSPYAEAEVDDDPDLQMDKYGDESLILPAANEGGESNGGGPATGPATTEGEED